MDFQKWSTRWETCARSITWRASWAGTERSEQREVGMTTATVDESTGKVSGFLGRTEALLGTPCLQRFSRACVAVAGLGGVGGAILPTLVRMGIGHFRIADPGLYDEPDMNRQWGATHLTMGKNKTEVYTDFIKSVNPDADVVGFPMGVTEENIAEFLEGADVLIEALDLKVEPALRLKVAAHARKNGIYNINSPIVGFGSAVASAAPDGMQMDEFMKHVAQARKTGKMPAIFSKVFSASYIDIIETQIAERRIVPSIAIAPTLTAAMVATEVAMIIGGEEMPGWRKPVCLPDLIVTDLARMSSSVISIADLSLS
ncbi:MAG: hypothetical protein C0404_12020 [Verrucomicrobia bacterium]|nr:hypothetical protein [Verrucomicrobiota bacterium]